MDRLAGMMNRLMFRVSVIRDGLSLRIVSAMIIVLVLLSLGAGFLFLHRNTSEQQTATTTGNTVYPLQQIPVPDAGRTQYTNAKYKYNFIYPSEWNVSESNFNNVDTITISYQVQTGPDVRLLAVNCTADTANWDAQTWWQHNPTGAEIGFTLLKSGERAFVSVTSDQQAEQGYTQYIVVHKQTVCWLAASTANAANEHLMGEIINTFHWN